MTNRRAFFKILISEAWAFFDELEGRPQLRLADISKLPDATLAEIIPILREGVKIVATEDDVRTQIPRNDKPIVIFIRDPPNTFTFNRFNGRTTIGLISTQLADVTSWSKDKAFLHVKKMFLHLINLGVCVPQNPVGKFPELLSQGKSQETEVFADDKRPVHLAGF